MNWIIVALAGALIAVFGAILHMKRSKGEGGQPAMGLAQGLGLGLLVTAVICAVLAEGAGIQEVWDFAPLGFVLGLALGAYIEKRRAQNS